MRDVLRKSRINGCAVMLMLIAACTPSEPPFDVAVLANDLFTTWQSNDMNKLLTFYSDEFYQGIPRELWRGELEKITTQFGPIQSFRLRKQQADTRYSGKFYIYQFETTHNNEEKVRHIVTFVWPVNDNKLKLVGHKITAKHLQ